ncbi:MAG: ABC transporter ATP-binding protein [Planctomycetota bacterium]
MTEPLIQVRGLSKDYPRQRVDASRYARLWDRVWGWTGRLDDWPALNVGIPVLKDVDMEVHEGETLAIVGPSGAGKSTLLHLMGALDHPSAGSVHYRDVNVTALGPRKVAAWRNREVGYVFQFYHLFPDLTALENVLVPGMIRYGAAGYPAHGAELQARAVDLLTQVGLGDRINHRPSQLSGGEQQRVAIARALLLRPKLLLCDEPTGNLDRRTGEAILEVLFALKAEGQTYVVVTHDERLADRADRVVRMADGRLGTRDPAQEAPSGEPFPIKVTPPEEEASSWLLSAPWKIPLWFALAFLVSGGASLATNSALSGDPRWLVTVTVGLIVGFLAVARKV